MSIYFAFALTFLTFVPINAARVLLSLYVGAASFILIPFFTSAVVLALLSFAFGLGMGCGQPKN